MWKDMRIIFIVLFFSHDQIFGVIDVLEVMLQQCSRLLHLASVRLNDQQTIVNAVKIINILFDKRMPCCELLFCIPCSIPHCYCIDWLSLIWAPKLTTRSWCILDCVADWKQFKQKKSDSVLALCIDTQNRSLQTSHSPIIPEQLSVKLMEFNWKYTAAPAKTLIQQLSQQNYSNNIPLIPLKCCENAAYQHEKNHQMSCCDMALFIFTVPVNGPCAHTHTNVAICKWKTSFWVCFMYTDAPDRLWMRI